jgi:hypothetical protein
MADSFETPPAHPPPDDKPTPEPVSHLRSGGSAQRSNPHPPSAPSRQFSRLAWYFLFIAAETGLRRACPPSNRGAIWQSDSITESNFNFKGG